MQRRGHSDRRRGGPRKREAGRLEDDRAEPVVGADARERLARDPLLERREPERVREAGAAEAERGRDGDARRSGRGGRAPPARAPRKRRRGRRRRAADAAAGAAQPRRRARPRSHRRSRCRPQAVAPPSDSSATNGPSTNSGAIARFDIEKRTTVAHTQVRAVTSRQPSRSSTSTVARGRAADRGSRRHASDALETANVAASIANTQPGPTR